MPSHRLRVSHLHRCHRLDDPSGGPPLLLFLVVQGHSIPCHWAHAYALVPGSPAPISRPFSFDIQQLETYRQLHTDQTLRWMDPEFMFKLALDQLLQQLAPLLPVPPSGLSSAVQIDNAELLRHFINGDIPMLDALLDVCGQHYLLHRQLQDIRSFPALRTDPLGLTIGI